MSDIEKKVLSQGLKFCVQPSHLDYCCFLTPFEKLASTLKKISIYHPCFSFDYVKTNLKSFALASFHRFSSSLPSNISKAEITALINPSNNKGLVIIRPDKGNGVVLLNRSDYISEVETILNGVSELVTLECDPP